jgi:hypothetical protein
MKIGRVGRIWNAPMFQATGELAGRVPGTGEKPHPIVEWTMERFQTAVERVVRRVSAVDWNIGMFRSCLAEQSDHRDA